MRTFFWIGLIVVSVPLCVLASVIMLPVLGLIGIEYPVTSREPVPLRRRARCTLTSCTSVVLVASSLILTGCLYVPRHTVAFERERHWQVTTNRFGCVGRHLVYERVWRDSDRFTFSGVGIDPKAAGIAYQHTNLTVLGGVSTLSVGTVSAQVNSNAVAIIPQVVEGAVKGAVEGAKTIP